ncbi:nucleotidyltransferase family protein [Collinsella intestinalis]|uniref:nucleotidyltransferase family protein n=1 Tax=Collinsella intestinalis TaxID=147207 RepID=UPI00195B8998|nr:nucleotidyltransferase domain-containing protein [Collinsella intestinalis]MBM6683395.1 nucleotidyltransferase domain-containing protein [Collinsella intestinalis]
MASPQMFDARRRDISAVLSPDQLSSIREVCCKHPYVRELYLFGSRARGDCRASSDYDFYARFDEELMERRSDHLKLIDDLISVLRQRVDLICGEVWTARDEGLKREIERDGVLVYDRDAQ